MALTRAARGKGIIISSGARSAFELRGPYDVINMATLFGLSEQDAKANDSLIKDTIPGCTLLLVTPSHSLVQNQANLCVLTS